MGTRFEGSCDVTNEAELLSTARLPGGGGGGGGVGGMGARVEAGRLEGDVAMETYRGAGEAVAVGGDDSTLAACK